MLETRALVMAAKNMKIAIFPELVVVGSLNCW
jgi:hypothetical protein